MDWSPPLFPDLFPRLTDPLWYLNEKVTDDDSELTQLEHEHTAWVCTQLVCQTSKTKSSL